MGSESRNKEETVAFLKTGDINVEMADKTFNHDNYDRALKKIINKEEREKYRYWRKQFLIRCNFFARIVLFRICKRKYERKKYMRNRLNPKIILIVCILTGGLLLCCGLLNNNMDKINNQVILCFQEKDQINKRYKEENNIIVDNCRESLVDYNKKKQNILYNNYQNEFIEQNILTGKIDKLSILDTDNDIRNLQYGPGSNEISYIKEGCIYVYDRVKEKTRKITDSDYSQWRNTYAWKNEKILYIINPVEHGELRKLFVINESGKKVPKTNTDSIQCFTLCDNESKIYAIIQKVKYNGITMALLYELTEIDLVNNTSKKLTDIDTMTNLMLECIDNKYLIYVEKQLSKKSSKVYCYNIESGKKKCIYKTDNNVIGAVVK